MMTPPLPRYPSRPQAEAAIKEAVEAERLRCAAIARRKVITYGAEHPLGEIAREILEQIEDGDPGF